MQGGVLRKVSYLFKPGSLRTPPETGPAQIAEFGIHYILLHHILALEI